MDEEVPGHEDRTEAVLDRPDPGHEPPDPADVRGVRLHGGGAAAGAHHAHPAREAADRALAQSQRAGDRAAASEEISRPAGTTGRAQRSPGTAASALPATADRCRASNERAREAQAPELAC